MHCTNCGRQYSWQASGDYWQDWPKEYNHDKYCPICAKVVYDGLKSVNKVSEKRHVEINFDDGDFVGLLTAYATHYKCKNLVEEFNAGSKDPKDNKFTCTQEHIIKGKSFIFSYWAPSMLPRFITIESRWDIINDCLYDDNQYNYSDEFRKLRLPIEDHTEC